MQLRDVWKGIPSYIRTSISSLHLPASMPPLIFYSFRLYLSPCLFFFSVPLLFSSFMYLLPLFMCSHAGSHAHEIMDYSASSVWLSDWLLNLSYLCLSVSTYCALFNCVPTPPTVLCSTMNVEQVQWVDRISAVLQGKRKKKKVRGRGGAGGIGKEHNNPFPIPSQHASLYSMGRTVCSDTSQCSP